MVDKIGILGAGTIGQAVARYLLKGGHGVLLSNSRGPETLAHVVGGLGPGASAATARDAAYADVVVLAIPWDAVAATLPRLGPWDSRIVVDATNAVATMSPFRLHDFGKRTSTELVAELVPGARVVKAFNTLPQHLFYPIADDDARRVAFLSGDDPEARAAVSALVHDMGFAPLDLGGLAAGSRMQQAGAPLAALDLRLAGGWEPV